MKIILSISMMWGTFFLSTVDARASSTEQAVLAVTAEDLHCYKGKLIWNIQNSSLTTRLKHRYPQSQFSSQFQCLKFVVNSIESYGPSVALTYDVELIEKQSIRTRTYDCNCRWTHAWDLDYRCQSCTKTIAISIITEVLSLEFNGAKFTSELQTKQDLE